MVDRVSVPDGSASSVSLKVLPGGASANIKSEAETLSVPHNLEIEGALLSALLFDNGKYELIGELLKAEYFYAPYHRRIYEIISAMIDKGQVVTLGTLQHILASDEVLREDGLDYLSSLATSENPLLGGSAEYYALTIRDLYRKRCLITVGEDVVRDAYDLSDLDSTAERQIERAEEKLYHLAETDSGSSMLSLREALKSALDTTSEALLRDSHVVGVTTGFVDIDAMLGGLHPSDLIILAGRPSMGKTALATNIAFNAARRFCVKRDKNGKEVIEGARVLFFSLEMSSNQLGLRILGELSGVSSDKMRRGKIRQSDFDNISEAAMEMGQVPLYIDDTPALNVSALRQRARRWKRSKGLDLIVIDYLQLLQAGSGRSENRVMELSAITRALKTIAKELNIPILALSQLSREVERREDKRPQLADLRESGTIEQDSDVVMFLYREEYYLQRGAPVMKEGMSEAKHMELETTHNQRLEAARNRAQVIIAKQRHGATGIIDLHFDALLTRFSDLAREEGL